MAEKGKLKTNAMRLLDARQVPYKPFSYHESVHSAESAAAKLEHLGGAAIATALSRLSPGFAQDVLDSFTIGAESVAEFQDLLKRIPAASVRA